MAKKADAWKEYKEAALVDMMLQVLDCGDIDNILIVLFCVIISYFCLLNLSSISLLIYSLEAEQFHHFPTQTNSIT